MQKIDSKYILSGESSQIKNDYIEYQKIKVDLDLSMHKNNSLEARQKQVTIEMETEVKGHGTFDYRKIRKLKFCPTEKPGWWFKRTDLPGAELLKVDYKNAWTANYAGVNNIIIGKRGSDNIVRLTEHIIALKPILGIDNLIIEIDSFDPPLFEHGSLDIVETLTRAGKKELDHPVKYYSLREKVVMGFGDRGILILEPPERDSEQILKLDCAIKYPNNVMGYERIKIPVDDVIPLKGITARTNTSLKHAILCKTLGKLFPSTRYLGYNKRNVLIVGKSKYYNKPRLFEKEKSLEPIWHRAVLDLLAAVALIPGGCLIGNLISYKAGHTQDVEFIKKLFAENLLFEI